MAYEVTATRKRPQAFEKLVGQEFVVSTIENAIESGRIAHAYLFSGPRGVGKTSSARLLAKALNCKNGPTAHPCGECDNCKEITAGSAVDVIEIDGASNTSVNDIRVIKDEVLFPPQASRYKIYIIDEVHMLSNSAFNALLKTIEEPPEYIIFIFATTELQKVPATIRSRCQQFHFQLIPLHAIKGCLKEAAEEMGIEADDDALFWIAKEATGSMRDAYTLFDQVASFSGNRITLAGIRDKLGIVSADKISNIIAMAISGQRQNAIKDLAGILSEGLSVEQCIKSFTDFFRALLFVKEGIVDEELLNMRSEDIPQELVKLLSVAQLEAAMRTLLQLYREIRYSISPRFELELFISRLSSLRDLSTPEELVRKLDEMRENVINGKATVVKEVVQNTVTVKIEEKKTEEPVKQQILEAPKNERIAEEKEPETAPVAPSKVAAAIYTDNEEEEEEEENTPALKAPTMEDIYNLADRLLEGGDFSIGSALNEVSSLFINNNGILELRVKTDKSAAMLRNNMRVVKKGLQEIAKYEGDITATSLEGPKKVSNPIMERIARDFRGSVVFEETDNNPSFSRNNNF
ncbi:MAG: DNA polymerase III subunit gamma/tau [Sphaerochaetaceae bacterium]|nr:DNA polymerase III subunit gamma/tau [Sphaerochaetaceae bacterium]